MDTEKHAESSMQLGVSINGGTYKSSIYRWIFLYKPCILGYSHLWNPRYLFKFRQGELQGTDLETTPGPILLGLGCFG